MHDVRTMMLKHVRVDSVMASSPCLAKSNEEFNKFEEEK